MTPAHAAHPAERRFTLADQRWFASLSGDANPMHLDPLAARRTMAGRPAVHGIHAVLWALDGLLAEMDPPAPPQSLSADFRKMILVEDRVRLIRLQEPSPESPVLRARLVADGVAAFDIALAFGETPRAAPAIADGPLREPRDPLALSFEDMAGNHGRTRLEATRAEALARAFPAAARALGPARVAGLACSSYLVGMVCPGLHSIYAGLRLGVNEAAEASELQFRVTASDARFRRLTLTVAGYGWDGTITAFARPEPVAQAGLDAVAARVEADEFSDRSVLVLGGSRGLGELVAKLAAAGGAAVTLTYAVGEADAGRIRAEIRTAGGRCEILRYDVRQDAQDQVAGLPAPPSEAYYLASPQIFRRRAGLYDGAAFEDFLAYYVAGFQGFCRALRDRFPQARIPVFYPSSVAVETRPANMTEYAMAKAAGEILCADLSAAERPGPILMRRLPRLPTDQTATLMVTEEVDPIAILLPIIRAMGSPAR